MHLGNLVDASRRNTPFTSLLCFDSRLLHQAVKEKSGRKMGLHHGRVFRTLA